VTAWREEPCDLCHMASMGLLVGGLVHVAACCLFLFHGVDLSLGSLNGSFSSDPAAGWLRNDKVLVAKDTFVRLIRDGPAPVLDGFCCFAHSLQGRPPEDDLLFASPSGCASHPAPRTRSLSEALCGCAAGCNVEAGWSTVPGAWQVRRET